MSDGHRSGRSTGSVSCKSTKLNYYYYYFDPGTQFPGNEKIRYAIQKSTKINYYYAGEYKVMVVQTGSVIVRSRAL